MELLLLLNSATVRGNSLSNETSNYTFNPTACGASLLALGNRGGGARVEIVDRPPRVNVGVRQTPSRQGGAIFAEVVVQRDGRISRACHEGEREVIDQGGNPI